jgi:asparagine synthetase B (glutamine-hydrolysing)
MIGLSGAVSFDEPLQRLTEFAKELRGYLKSELINSKEYRHPSGVFTLYDENIEGSSAREDGIFCLVTGDIYEDDFQQNRNMSKADYVRRLYLKGGAKACTKLNGSYLFLLLDDKKKQCHIGTDQNSFIPLYYVDLKGTLCFSWDMSKLVGILPDKPEVNFDNLITWLLIGPPGYDDGTRFKSVKRLEAGAYVSLERRTLSINSGDVFSYKPIVSSEKDLVEDVIDTLGLGMRRRTGNRDVVLFGLSGGLDSRIVISALKKEFEGECVCYTYGVKNFVEATIARKVAQYFEVPHTTIELDDLLYIDYARDGIFYSGGMSYFKHGVQPHLFAEMKKKYRAQGIMLGSALDLSLGSSHTPDEICDFSSRDQLFRLYQNRLFHYNRKDFLSLFSHKGRGEEYYDRSLSFIEKRLNTIPGDHPVDINVAFIFDTRVRRWYNHNLVYPLYSHRLLTPTYDHDFLAAISKIPWQLRKDSVFRIKLLKKMNQGVSEIAHDTSMEPAWLPPPYPKRFEGIQYQIDELRQQIWIDSDQTIYLPSNRYDANFLEWFRVYPKYQEYLYSTLTGSDSVMCDLFFDRNKIKQMIDRHISGKAAYHKELIMMTSAELFCRIFMKNEPGVNHEFQDFSSYLK